MLMQVSGSLTNEYSGGDGMHGKSRMWIGYLGMFVMMLVLVTTAGSTDATPLLSACCMFFIFLGIASSGHEAAKKWKNRIVIYQQPVQPQMVQQQSVIIQQQAPVQQVAPSIQEPEKSPGWWLNHAQKLEVARDWEGAAQAYQKAGLYEEAGRIRSAHIEDKDNVVLNIDRVGDNILHDSVLFQDGTNDGEEDEL